MERLSRTKLFTLVMISVLQEGKGGGEGRGGEGRGEEWNLQLHRPLCDQDLYICTYLHTYVCTHRVHVLLSVCLCKARVT